MGTTRDLSVEIASRHAVYMEGLKTGHVKAFDKFLRVMQRDILEQVRRISDPSKMSARRLNGMLKAISTTLKTGGIDYEKVWRAQIAEVGIYSADFEVRALGKVLKFDYTLPTPAQITTAAFSTPLSAAGFEGILLEPFFKDIIGKTQQRVAGAVRLVAAQGGTTQDLVRRIRGTRAGSFMDGLMQVSRRDAEAIARTSLHHVANVSRELVWSENSEVIEQVEYLAVLDGRTSTQCRSLSGQRFDIGKGPIPPIHINCRSTRVAVFKDGLDFLDKAGSQFARGETGVQHVSPDLTYYSWLKNQSAGFQDSVIGPDRGLLLRNGGLTSKRFAELQLNKNFQPLTLDDMRKLEPLAFESAGI